MILRRVIVHFRKQEWTAIAIDFLIVVVGVFVGIQVSNWNAAQADEKRLDQQLAALSSELEGNLAKIDGYRNFAADQVAAINELRATFSGDLNAAEPDRVDALLFLTLRVLNLQPELTAYEDLADSGSLRRLAGTPLRRAISRWESVLAYVRRLDRDALAHRDDVVLPFVAGNFSLAAMGDGDPEQTSLGFGRSRFRNNVDQLAQSVELENMLALRFILEAQILKHSERLEQSTRALIAALNERKKRP
jgi:hypothetical protein